MKPQTCARIFAPCPVWLWYRLPASWRVHAVWLCVPAPIKRQLMADAKQGETLAEFRERMKLIARGKPS